jgi:hypothetical protein
LLRGEANSRIESKTGLAGEVDVVRIIVAEIKEITVVIGVE